jgi:hypothetical protein
MPTIPFPNVPQSPGVPALPRSGEIPPAAVIALGAVTQVLATALQSGTQWGIFDSEGNQLGSASQGSNGFFQAIVNAAAAAIIGGGAYLSTNAFELTGETRISDFPIEGGSFSNYNKVIRPLTPTVTLALAGSTTDRTAFLNQIEAARLSTDLYSVVTPEVTYHNYAVEKYNVVRRAERGATLLLVEINLLQIRQVTASFSTVQTPINTPQNPDATPPSNSGMVQPQAPQQSVLKSTTGLFSGLGNN